MSTAFDSIKQGLQEAIAHAKGDAPEVRIHYPRAVDVKAVRAKVGMTQEQFAARFGFSTATLRHWAPRTSMGLWVLAVLAYGGLAAKAVIDNPVRSYTDLEAAQADLKISLMAKGGKVSAAYDEVMRQATDL